MRYSVPIALVAVGVAAVIACGGGDQERASSEPAKVDHVVYGEFVNSEDSLPRVRYFEDDQVSLNDRCPVRKVRLNPKMPPAYVNRRPVGFC